MHKDVNNFLDHWPSIQESLKNKDILLFLDYDGTLTPIVERPEFAVLSNQTKELLEKLAKNGRFKVFIISGRVLSDVKKIAGIDNIVYVGNHGLEIEGAGIDFQNFPFERFREILEYLKWEINKELIFLKGAFVEDKGLGLGVHYRMLDAKNESIFEIFLERITHDFLFRNEIRILQGKKVFEIRPPIEWDKGKAVLWLLKPYEDIMKDQRAVAIYIGDDRTDEDAFHALHNIAMTVHVGDFQSTGAKHFVANSQEVEKFLECLVNLKGQKG